MPKEKLKLGATIVKIREALPNELDSNKFGEFTSYGPRGSLEIILQPGLSKKRRKATIIHEAMHAIFYCTGITHLLKPEIEEFLCDSFSHLYGVLEEQI